MKRLFFVMIVIVAVFTAHAQNSYDESLYILFPANSANFRRVSPELARQNQKVLDEIAKMLLENPYYRILIDGHANPVLKTAREETMTLLPLSLERATVVANYLVEKYKIDRRRFILTGGGGKYASGNDAAQNRRVNLFIIVDKRNIAGVRRGLSEEINSLIPDNILEAIGDIGIEINGGKNPPNIEGTYFVDTLHLVKSTAGAIAEQWNKYVTFSGQDNTTLTINADYTMQTNNHADPLSSKGPGSYIVGEGNKFTVVVDGTREQGGFTAKTIEIFSGEISDAGIKNYHWAVMMVDNSGNPLGVWIKNSTGYTKKDGDGFSERVESK